MDIEIISKKLIGFEQEKRQEKYLNLYFRPSILKTISYLESSQAFKINSI